MNKKHIPPTLDATKYYFTSLYRETESNVFDMFVKPNTEDRPSIVRSVRFNNLENTDYGKNGSKFTYYCSGTVYEYEAVELNNGKFLFCVVRGTQFAGTFASHRNIHMEYYEVTLIK
jgi:hypothetical protein